MGQHKLQKFLAALITGLRRSPLTERDFANILEYLNKNWDEKVTNNFINLTAEVIIQISVNPRQFPVIYKKEKIRKWFLTKHIPPNR